MSTALLVLVGLQCLWLLVAGVMLGLMWQWRREGKRNLEAARKLHDDTMRHLAECARAVIAAKRAGVDLDTYMHDA